jgi:hypothetical protein
MLTITQHVLVGLAICRQKRLLAVSWPEESFLVVWPELALLDSLPQFSVLPFYIFSISWSFQSAEVISSTLPIY